MPVVTANILQPLIDVAETILVFFHENVGLSWGFSIIALTFTIRIFLIPLAVKQFRSMQELQRYAPQMKALQDRYKDDRQKLQQEMMKFYQEHKVNPLASCLPLLAQFPVFISLFYLLRGESFKEDVCPAPAGKAVDYAKMTCEQIDPGSAKFLFIPDLTAAPVGWVLVVLILLYVGSQIGSSLLMSSSTMDPTQRKIMFALPLVFVIFIVSFPAGLIVYWITTNVWTVFQQVIVKRIVGHTPPLAIEGPSDGKVIDVAESTPAPPPPPGKKKQRSGKKR